MALDASRQHHAVLANRLLLAAALLFAAFVRGRLADIPLERDEGEYAYAGQLLLEGVPPYQLAYNMKLPGTYVAYAAIMAVFGQSAVGIHLGLLIVNALTIWLIYRLTGELVGSIGAGFAAVAYAILSMMPNVLGQAGHATHFVALCGVAGALVLWRHRCTPRLWTALAAGLLLGLAFVMKQQGVFLMLFGAAWLATFAVRPGDYPRRRLPGVLLVYSVGAALPYLLVCWWMWRAGVWTAFRFWTIEYAARYVQQVSFDLAVYLAWTSSWLVIGGNWPLWGLALVGVLTVVRGRTDQPGWRTFVLGYAVFSTACIVPGFIFREHYYIAMLPAVAVLSGIGAAALWTLDERSWVIQRFNAWWNSASVVQDDASADPQKFENPPIDSRPIAALLLILSLALPVAVYSDTLFRWTPDEVCHRIYLGNPFVESREIAAYLQRHSTPDQTIAVLGSEPQIAFESRRRSCTGYIYTYALMEPQPFALRMQEEMIQEIEAGRPEFVVVVNVLYSWLRRNKVDRIFRWQDDYLPQHYDRVGVVEIGDVNSEFWWDRAA
jgi:4-amino-4-deoxy-L-arabinose transferase-like glycosyltransferase